MPVETRNMSASTTKEQGKHFLFLYSIGFVGVSIWGYNLDLQQTDQHMSLHKPQDVWKINKNNKKQRLTCFISAVVCV